MNLFSLARKFPNEDAALLHLIRVRWPHGVRCIACDHDKCWLVESKGKTGKPRRLFQCAECGLQFSATAGTLFHDSHLPLTKWFAAIALMTEAKKGVSAMQVQRHIGMTYKTAWYLCQRIREAMQEPADSVLGGQGKIVEIDETMIGGRVAGAGVVAGGANKISVVGMVERGGRVHMQTVKKVNKESLQAILDAKLSPDTDKIVTDGGGIYRKMFPADKHEAGNHTKEKRARQKLTNQTVEGAFSLFKRGVVGSYHRLGMEHLDRYLGEFCWRYNRRAMQPWMFEMALTNLVGKKPLPYKKLTEF